MNHKRHIIVQCLVLLIACGCASRSTIRVMTYNIHHAAGADGKVDIARIAKIIKSADPDLVAIQEVDRCTKRSGGIDEGQELERLTGMNVVWGKAMAFDGGEYGQLLLASPSIRSSTVFHLPGSQGREPRIVLTGEVRVIRDLPPLVFASTHLDHEIAIDRLAQAGALSDYLGTNAENCIVAGDMNAEPESPTMQRLLQTWRDTSGPAARTYPATRPSKKIDWILIPRSLGWRVVKAQVLNEPTASDHRPLVVDVEWVGSR